MKQSEPLICSLGVFAYNEAGNILALLEALTSQELRNVKIAEIIVVSSASTDGTDELVAEYSQSHPQVKLIRQASSRTGRRPQQQPQRGQHLGRQDAHGATVGQ